MNVFAHELSACDELQACCELGSVMWHWMAQWSLAGVRFMEDYHQTAY